MLAWKFKWTPYKTVKCQLIPQIFYGSNLTNACLAKQSFCECGIKRDAENKTRNRKGHSRRRG